MKNSERDEEAFEEKPRPKRPVQQDDDEPRRRKAPPPIEEGHIEEGERPRPRSRQEDAEEEADVPRRRSRSRYEEEDEEDDRSHRRPRGRDEEPYSAMIPYRNVTALIGYYCGMISLIAILGGIALIFYNPINPQFVGIITLVVIYGLGGILALLAIILGIIGMVYANKHPRSRGMGHAIAGIVLGILEILGLVTLLVLGYMATRRF
jgi:hypothetical protein